MPEIKKYNSIVLLSNHVRNPEDLSYKIEEIEA